MFDWIQTHSASLQLGSSLVMTVVWVTYLQLLVRSFSRQRRTMVLVNRGAGVGLDARCFISNLGFEPIYVLDLLVTLTRSDGSKCKTFITDRTELAAKDLNNPSDATNQGPLKSGDFRDVGSFRQLLERANRTLDPQVPEDEVDCMDLCVLAASASSTRIVAAHRAYSVSTDGRGGLMPEKPTTTQLRTAWGRRKITTEMRRRF